MLQAHVHDYISGRSKGAPLVSWPFNAYIQNINDGGSGIAAMVTDNTSNTITEALNVASTGGGDAQNLQPYSVVNHIIKT